MDAIELVRKQAIHDATTNEVTQARTSGITGTLYPTLKQRLDDVDSGLTDLENLIGEAIEGLQWKESVPTFGALATEYPNAEEGWTASVEDTDEIYRYDATTRTWKKIADFSNIPVATPQANGLMSSTDKTKLDNIENNFVGKTGQQTITGSLTVTGGITGTLTGNSSSATQLANARDITLENDVTGSASFNGTANAVIQATLKDVNPTATDVQDNIVFGGTFKAISSVATDNKGRVTAVETKEFTVPQVTNVNGANVVLTGYNKGNAKTPILATDTVNTAVGKLEVTLDDKINTGTVKFTMNVTEQTIQVATTKDVMIGAEVGATDIVRVYLSGVRLNETKHYTLTRGNNATAKITGVNTVEFINNDHITFEIIKTDLA